MRRKVNSRRRVQKKLKNGDIPARFNTYKSKHKNNIKWNLAATITTTTTTITTAAAPAPANQLRLWSGAHIKWFSSSWASRRAEPDKREKWASERDSARRFQYKCSLRYFISFWSAGIQLQFLSSSASVEWVKANGALLRGAKEKERERGRESKWRERESRH